MMGGMEKSVLCQVSDRTLRELSTVPSLLHSLPPLLFVPPLHLSKLLYALAITGIYGEMAFSAQTQEAAAMTEGNAKCIEWVPAAAPGLLASLHPGLELCLCFFVPDL